MNVKLPKISTSWALSIVAACLVFGGVWLIFLMPPEPVNKATVAVLDLSQASPLQDPEVPQTRPEEDAPERSENVPPVVEQPPLEEKIITHQEPLVLPERMSIADLTQEKESALPVIKRVLNPLSQGAEGAKKTLKTTPYYNGACVENRGEGRALPIQSPEGLKPFDVYQGDSLPDPTKTQLTLVISELGANLALFEQVKASFPKEVVCGFLAIRALSQKMNNEARELGHETLLMLPLEPMNYPQSDPGPWALLTNLTGSDNQKRLERHLSQFTGYIGVTPYMGNRFSRVKKDFQPILKEIKRRGLSYFEPRLVRSKAVQWKPAEMLYAKGNYDIVRGSSVQKIAEILARVKEDLENKRSVILTVQADRVSLQEVHKWLPKILDEDTVLVPLSAVTE